MFRIGFICVGAAVGTLLVMFSDVGPREAPVYLTSLDTRSLAPLEIAPDLQEPAPTVVQAALVVQPAPAVLPAQAVEIATRATADPFDTLTLLPNPVIPRTDPAPLVETSPTVAPAAATPQDFETAEAAMLARMDLLETAPILTTHVVKRGESLTAISNRYYGNFTGYVYIFEANRGSLTTPENLAVGMELTIPNIDAL